MRTFSGKRSTLAPGYRRYHSNVGVDRCSAGASLRLFDDSTLTGGIYYWQRERDRKDVTDGDKYKTNLSHATGTLTLDFQSGYAADMFGLDIAAFTAIEMAENGDSGHPNEIAFSKRIKATTKTIPAIRAVSVFIKPQRNLNMARSGRAPVIFSLPVRRC